MTLPPPTDPPAKWPLWILGMTLIALLLLAMVYSMNPEGLSF